MHVCCAAEYMKMSVVWLVIVENLIWSFAVYSRQPIDYVNCSMKSLCPEVTRNVSMNPMTEGKEKESRPYCRELFIIFNDESNQPPQSVSRKRVWARDPSYR